MARRPFKVVPGVDPEPPDDSGEPQRTRPSRSQKKREARVVFDLGEVLVKLRPAALKLLPLDDELREAVVFGQTLTKNARARHLRRIAKLLRSSDTQALTEALRDAGHLL